jgi:beta-mannosidase
VSAALSGFELTWTDGSWPGEDAQWVPAVVPGGVHESLLRAGLIEDPYFGMHELELDWVHEATWWYRTRFTSAAGDLRFAGLDTVADVYVDGQLVGSARNQHRTHTFPGGHDGDHELVVRFPPPLAAVVDDAEVQQLAEAHRARHRTVRPQDPPLDEAELLLRVSRPRLRKATFSWGWDFAPLVTSRGISAPVTVEHAPPALRDLSVRSEHVDVASRTTTIVVTGTAYGTVSVEVTAPEGQVHSAVTDASGPFEVRLALADVQLWWTHDLGDPALYGVSVSVGDETTVVRHGVRTIELDRSPDPEEGGSHFRFVLNGCPTFSRGANWVPPSMLVGSVSDEVTRELVRLARDGGMTMLRVWGGGVHGTDAFYDACDELGVLVWQDFMFACFDYPDPRGELAAELRLEAAEHVRRIRHHASLALWCGENEVQGIHELTHGNADPGDWGWSLFNEVLPAVVAAENPDTAYWPGSPWGEEGLLNGTRDGDRHAWEVWHGNDVGAGGPTEFASRGEAVHFSRYEHDHGRFISEFGIHAAPELATLERWTPPGSLALGSPQLLQRIKDTPKDKGWALMGHETGEPTTLIEYVDFSMACQAEGLKHGIEHYRRRQPHCNGTLVWQLNDPWPGLSWSVIDYDLVPKAAYYYLQRAYQPLLASFRVQGETLELWVSNSGNQPVALELAVEIADLRAGPATTAHVAVTSPPYSSAPVWTGPRPAADQVAVVSEAAGQLPRNRRFFAPLKDLPVREGKLHASSTVTGPSSATVTLTAEGYCYLARVLCDQPGARFSANYVDLRDGETVTVYVTDIPAGAALSASTYGADPVPL